MQWGSPASKAVCAVRSHFGLGCNAAMSKCSRPHANSCQHPCCMCMSHAPSQCALHVVYCSSFAHGKLARATVGHQPAQLPLHLRLSERPGWDPMRFSHQHISMGLVIRLESARHPDAAALLPEQPCGQVQGRSAASQVCKPCQTVPAVGIVHVPRQVLSGHCASVCLVQVCPCCCWLCRRNIGSKGCGCEPKHQQNKDCSQAQHTVTNSAATNTHTHNS